jgi:hypothetical protein
MMTEIIETAEDADELDLTGSEKIYDDAFSGVKRIHSLILSIEQNILSFYGVVKTGNAILINTVDIGDAYMVTLKFTKTFKRVRFYISKDSPDPLKTVMVHNYVKTTNICKDIDQIYKEVDNYYIHIDRLNKFNLGKVYIWGMTPDSTRVDEVYKAPAKHILGMLNEDIITGKEENVLYYDMIQSVKFTGRVFDTTVTVADITLNCGNQFSVVVSNDTEHRIKPGSIFVINSIGRYNVFNLATAKQHLILSKDVIDNFTKIAKG